MARRFFAWILAGACVVSLSVWYPHTSIRRPLKARQPLITSITIAMFSLCCRASASPVTALTPARARIPCASTSAEMATKKRRWSGATPIVPGQSAESEVIRRIYAEEEASGCRPKRASRSPKPRRIC